MPDVEDEFSAPPVEDVREAWTPASPLRARHPMFPLYDLLPGDLLHQEENGTWTKYAPGMQIGGFMLDRSEVRPIRVRVLSPLLYQYLDPSTEQVWNEAQGGLTNP